MDYVVHLRLRRALHSSDRNRGYTNCSFLPFFLDSTNFLFFCPLSKFYCLIFIVENDDVQFTLLLFVISSDLTFVLFCLLFFLILSK